MYSLVLQTLLDCSIATLGWLALKHALPGRLSILGAVVTVVLTCTKMCEEAKALPDGRAVGEGIAGVSSGKPRKSLRCHVLTKQR